MAVPGDAAGGALERALRRVFVDHEGGQLRHDLGGALVDAANEVLDERQGRRIEIWELNELFGLWWAVAASDDDGTDLIDLDHRAAGVDVIAARIVHGGDLHAVLELAVAPVVVETRTDDADEIWDIETYEFTVDERVYRFEAHEHDETWPTWSCVRADSDLPAATIDAPDAADDADPSDGPAAFRRSLLRRLEAADSGSLPHDLAYALLEAADAVFDHQEREREISFAELNALFGLDLGECLSDAKGNRNTISMHERDLAISEIVGYVLVSSWDVEQVVWEVADRVDSVDASPDGGMSVHEFTIDDGVYYFTLVTDYEIGEPEWWYGHSINDAETRERARGVGPRELWDENLYWAEHPELAEDRFASGPG